MNDYEKLEDEFHKKVAELQTICPHKKSMWCEKHWAIGHYCGYDVLVCNNCHKTLKERPTAEERKEKEKENNKQLYAKMSFR